MELVIFVSHCTVRTYVFGECGIVDLVVAGSSPVALATQTKPIQPLR